MHPLSIAVREVLALLQFIREYPSLDIEVRVDEGVVALSAHAGVPVADVHGSLSRLSRFVPTK
jgi:hypothetical protein